MRTAICAAFFTALMALPSGAEAKECRVALGKLIHEMDSRAGPILRMGPVFGPDRETELRLIIRSLALAAHNLQRRGEDEGCLDFVAQAQDKLKQL